MLKTIIISLLLSFIHAGAFAQLQPKSMDLENKLIIHFPFDGNFENISENSSDAQSNEIGFTRNLLNIDSTALKLKNQRLKIDFWKGEYSREYSVSFWFKPDADLNDKTTANSIKFIDSASKFEHCFTIAYQKGNLILNINFPEAPSEIVNLNKNQFSFPAKFFKNNWYFINYSFGENNDIRLTIDDKSYILGQINILKTNLGKMGDLNKPMVLGGDGQNLDGDGKQFFNGALDDLRIYTRILEENELAFLFRKKTEIFPVPIISWMAPKSLYTEQSLNSFKIKNCIKTESVITKIQIYINDVLSKEVQNPVKFVDENKNCDYVFENEILLDQGSNYIKIAAFDNNDGLKYSDERLIINKLNRIAGNQDFSPPSLNLVNPTGLPGFKVYTEKEQFTIVGNAIDESGIYNVKVNGITAEYDKKDGTFKANMLLNYGDNTIKVVAADINQNETSFIFFVNREKPDDNNNPLADNQKKRVALLIGNANYEFVKKLKNPLNDAKAVSEELVKLGFDTVMVLNGTKRQILRAVTAFYDKLSEDPNTIGLFYYAGHGMQIKGKNYLIPVDANVTRESEANEYCYDAEDLMATLLEAKNDMNLIILDACRNNPFEFPNNRSISGPGLGVLGSQAKGTFIAFATAPGTTASDGSGINGLYTQEFLKALKIPKLKIEEVFKRVRLGVFDLSAKEQTPWENSSLLGDFYFNRR